MLLNKKGGLYKNKKAGIFEKPIWFLIDLVISIVVFLILLGYVNLQGESLTFERDFLAKDIAILLDTLYAAPSSISLDYPQNALWFSYKFENDKVSVIERGLLEQKAQAFFINDKNLRFEEKTISPEKDFEDKRTFIKKYIALNWFSIKRQELPAGTSVNLYFLRNNEILGIENKEIPLKPSKLICPDIVTKDSMKEKIILLDQGDTDKDDRRPEITAAIAYALYNNLEKKVKEIKHTRVGNIWEMQKIRLDQTTIQKNIDVSDIIISLYIGDYKDNRNTIKAYYSSESEKEIKEKNRKLACLIINGLLSNNKLDIDGISVIETDMKEIPKNKIAILLEIGNINANEGRSIVTDVDKISEIAKSLAEGMKIYYS